MLNNFTQHEVVSNSFVLEVLISLPNISYYIGKGSALQILHDHPELVLDQVAVVHLHDVGVVVVPHYYDLNSKHVTLEEEKILVTKRKISQATRQPTNKSIYQFSTLF